MVTACNADKSPQRRFPAPTQPSLLTPGPQPLLPRQNPIVRQITFGDAIKDTMDSSDPPCTTICEASKKAVGMGGATTPCRHFLVIPPTNGTLVVELTWDDELTRMLLLLKMEEIESSPAKPRWSPLIGRAKVTAGQNYAVTIGAVGYDPFGGQFTLSTRMEE